MIAAHFPPMDWPVHRNSRWKPERIWKHVLLSPCPWFPDERSLAQSDSRSDSLALLEETTPVNITDKKTFLDILSALVTGSVTSSCSSSLSPHRHRGAPHGRIGGSWSQRQPRKATCQPSERVWKTLPHFFHASVSPGIQTPQGNWEKERADRFI